MIQFRDLFIPKRWVGHAETTFPKGSRELTISSDGHFVESPGHGEVYGKYPGFFGGMPQKEYFHYPKDLGSSKWRQFWGSNDP